MKFDFKEIKISDCELLTKLLSQNGDGDVEEISCEKQFATIFSWRLAHPVQYAPYGDGVVFRYRWNDECLFMIKQPTLDAFDACATKLYESCQFGSIKIINMTESEAKFLKEKYGIDYSYNSDYSDYIYSAESFRTYSGKKLHSKKNKLNKFMSLYGDSYNCKPLTESVINDCLYLLDEWRNDNDNVKGYKRKEIVATEQLILHFSELNLYGCCLYVGDKPIGFTIGEPLFEGGKNSTLVVHSEKASYDYDGAYPALAHFFALQHPDFVYINREDDGGVEGLRRSKRSYSPLFLLHKYCAVLDIK